MTLRTLLLTALIMLALPGVAPADPAADGQAAAHQGIIDGRADGAREGRERGAADGYTAGKRAGFEEAVECLGREAGKREGRERGEREAHERGFTQGREKGLSDGTREGEADGHARAEQESAGPARAQGASEADRSKARVLGTHDGAAGGEQDALSQAKKVDLARGRESYRTERWHLPPRSRNRYVVPRAGAHRGLDGALASTAFDLLAWSDECHVPSPDRRYWRSSPPYADSHRAHWYASTYGGAYHDGFREAYKSEFSSARSRGRDAGASEARGCSFSGNSVWRRAFDEAVSSEFHRVYDSIFPHVYDGARRAAYDETFRRLSQETREREYPAAFERNRQGAYEARYNTLYGDAFKAAHDTRYAALYPQLAKEWYAAGRADETTSFKDRPVRIAYVAVRDGGDGVVQPGETVRLDVVLRNFSTVAVPPGKLGLSIASKPVDMLSGAERRPNLPCGLGPAEELEIVDLVRLQPAPNAVGKSCSLDVRLQLNGKEVDSLTQDLAVQWPVTVRVESATPLVEGLAGSWRLVFENTTKKTIASMQVKVSTDSAQVSMPAAVLSLAALAPGAKATLPVDVTGWKTHESAPPTITVEVTGDGRLLNRTSLPVAVELRSPFTLDYLGGKLQLRKTGDWKVDFRLSDLKSGGPKEGGPVVAEAIVDQTCKTHIDIIGTDNGPGDRVAVRVRVYEPNSGGRFLLRVRRGGQVLMCRRVEF